MKKIWLSVFILFDLAVMAAAVFFLYVHVQKTSNRPAVAALSDRRAGKDAARSTQAAGVFQGMSPAAPSASPSDGAVRKILFTYHNPKAGEVAIRADFTGWKAEPMTRGEKGVWTFQASLEPGEYGYAYTLVDENGVSRTVRDMANPKTKKIGTQFVSSIVVAPQKN